MKNFTLLFTIVFSLLLSIFSTVFSQQHKILLDEIYSDWDNISGITDSGDANTGIDFQNLKVTNYNDYLFLLIKIDREINLQNDNSISLYIDTDNNPATGYSINGIGADLTYDFGNRKGKFYHNNTSTIIAHEDIGLVTLPTVTSNVFEIQLKKSSIVSGELVFQNSTITLFVKNNVDNGDIIPNNNSGYSHIFQNTNPQIKISYSIEKANKNHLRIVSYNVEKDKLFEVSNKEAHKRIFNAIKPDIIGFQEIYKHSAEQVANLIEEFLPSVDGEQWYYSKINPDIITISRFPISKSFAIGTNGAFLVDLQKDFNRELLFISAHTPCCGKDDARQKEIDEFMAFIRDAKNNGGILTVNKGTPIVIVGDMNLVGLKDQQTTLITGNIINNNLYGKSFLPDWDSTSFADAKPITTNMPSTFTWYDEGSSFSPGRLDYVVYSNSVMNISNSYVLFTKALPIDSLNLYNLQSNDVTSVADHLPVVADFEIIPLVSVKQSLHNSNYSFELYQNYPNPFNPTTKIKYEIGKTSFVTLKVYNSLGENIYTLINEEQDAGSYKIEFNGTNLSSGIYFYVLQSGHYIKSRKLLLLK